jgi:hypothetical protein
MNRAAFSLSGSVLHVSHSYGIYYNLQSSFARDRSARIRLEKLAIVEIPIP